MRLVRASLVVAMLAPPAWLVLEASVIAEAADARQTLAAIPTVLFSTSFGRVLIAQVLALLAAILAMRVRNHRSGVSRRWGLRGLLRCLRLGTATPSPWRMVRAYCSFSKACICSRQGRGWAALRPCSSWWAAPCRTWWPKRCGALPIPLLSRLPPRARHARGRVAVTGVNHAFTKLYFAPGSYGKLFFADVSVDREESPPFPCLLASNTPTLIDSYWRP